MKTIAITGRSEILSDILRQALFEEVILEAADGQRFILISVEGWKGFEISKDDDITENKELMKHLADRRSRGKRIHISEVRKQLGL